LKKSAGISLNGVIRIAIKIINGGQVFLKVRIGFDRLFAGIRLRVWEFVNSMGYE